jgi:hypothetical protein
MSEKMNCAVPDRFAALRRKTGHCCPSARPIPIVVVDLGALAPQSG